MYKIILLLLAIIAFGCSTNHHDPDPGPTSFHPEYYGHWILDSMYSTVSGVRDESWTDNNIISLDISEDSLVVTYTDNEVWHYKITGWYTGGFQIKPNTYPVEHWNSTFYGSELGFVLDEDETAPWVTNRKFYYFFRKN